MPLRILHVCQPTDGGAAVVVRHLVRAGTHAGDRVVVACPSGGYLSRWVQEEGARWAPLEMRRVPSVKEAALIAPLRALMKDADVVHLHSSKAGALGRMSMAFAHETRPKIIFTPHGWSWYVDGRASPLYRAFERLASRWTDVVTTVSQAEQADGRRVLGRRARIETIPNAVDTDAFGPIGDRAARGTERLIVQVGRLSRQKAQDRSIRALASLDDDAAQLRLVGEGPDHEQLQDLALRLGVSARVQFVGSVDPRPHIRAADVVVLPSRWEGMSLVLLEAMSLGAAVISSDCGGSDALGSSAMLVDHGNDDQAVVDLVRLIERLLGDEQLRVTTGLTNRNRAVEIFALPQQIDKYRQLWLEPRS